MKQGEFDFGPDRADLIALSPRHRGKAVLKARGIKNAYTLQSAVFRGVFIDEYYQAKDAALAGDIALWPKHPLIPEINQEKLMQAKEALEAKREDHFCEAVGIDAMALLDTSKGLAGWQVKEEARFRFCVLDEAALATAGEVELLRQKCDLLLLMGDEATQMDPVVPDEIKQFLTPEQTISAMAPPALERMGAVQLELFENWRSRNSISLAPGIIKNTQDKSFTEVIRMLLEQCPDIVTVDQFPTDLVAAGSPIYCYRNVVRQNLNLSAREAMGWAVDSLHEGQPFMIKAIDPALHGLELATLSTSSRWKITKVLANGRFNVQSMEKPSEFLTDITLRIAESYTDAAKFTKETGGVYPELGFKRALVNGILGFALNAHKVQGGQEDAICIYLEDFRWLAHMANWAKSNGIYDNHGNLQFHGPDGAPSWRKALSQCIGRAKHKVYLGIGYDCGFPPLNQKALNEF
jgi:hypothetical protein